MRSQPKAAQLKPLAVALATLILTGCANFSKDGGLDSVSTLTKERTGQTVLREKSADDAKAAQSAVDQLLTKPPTPDSAVQIALANNKGLQAEFAELDVAEASLVQAGRLRNPGYSFGRLRSGDNTEIDRSIMFDFVGLLTMPLQTEIEGRRFEQAKLQAASQAVQLAADTRNAYFTAVAAQQSAQYAEHLIGLSRRGQVRHQDQLGVAVAGWLCQRQDDAAHLQPFIALVIVQPHLLLQRALRRARSGMQRFDLFIGT
jgi:outer membrane protein TolC